MTKLATTRSAPVDATPLPALAPVHDRLMAAISILQVSLLARDYSADGEGMWGCMNMPDSALRHAIGLLIEILPDVEDI